MNTGGFQIWVLVSIPLFFARLPHYSPRKIISIILKFENEIEETEDEEKERQEVG